MNELSIVTGGCGRIGRYFLKQLDGLGHETVNLDLHNSDIASVNIKMDLTKRLNLDDLKEFLENKIASHERINFIHIAGIVGDITKDDWVTDLEYLGEDISKDAFMVACLSPAKIINELTKNFYVNAVYISSMYATKAPHFDLYSSSNKLHNPLTYSSTKASEVYSMKWLNNYFKGKLRLNCISPGGVESENMPNQFKREYLEKTLGNQFCSLDDISEAILFLLSDKAKCIYNQDLILAAGFD